MEDFIPKLGHKYDMVYDKEFTVCLKKCKICGIKKSLNEFADDKKSKDGKYSWCKSCKNEKQRERYNNLSKKDKSKLHKNSEKSRHKTLERWEPIIKDMYNMNKGFRCQCCGKNLLFPKFGLGGTNYSQSIYFDHKNNSVIIQGSPTKWLSTHTINSKNIKTFQLCNFGILCKNCNTRLGNPKGRDQRVLQDYKYVFGVPLNQSSVKAVQLESSCGAR